MDKRVFWASKSPLPQYHAITFDHPALAAPFRLVANQRAEVTLDGQVFTPAAMNITPPDQRSDAQPKLTMVFPRQYVGRQFKQQLKLIRGSGSRAPITATYALYLGVTSSPQVTWTLYASEQNGIQFSQDGVQVTATDDNPMKRQVGVIYDPATFTGLEIMR